VSKGQ